MHLLQQVASGRAGGRDSGGGLTGTKLCVLGNFCGVVLSLQQPTHTGGVGGHPVIQCDDDDDDDVPPQPRHKPDVFSEDHAVVMATSCVLGNGLNTARLGGGKKKGKRKCQQEELTWESQAEADPKTCPPEVRLTSWTLHVQE